MKVPCLDEKRLDGKRTYIYQPIQTLHKTKIRDIGPLIKEETITGTEWNTKEETVEQDFPWALGPKATQ